MTLELTVDKENQQQINVGNVQYPNKKLKQFPYSDILDTVALPDKSHCAKFNLHQSSPHQGPTHNYPMIDTLAEDSILDDFEDQDFTSQLLLNKRLSVGPGKDPLKFSPLKRDDASTPDCYPNFHELAKDSQIVQTGDKAADGVVNSTSGAVDDQHSALKKTAHVRFTSDEDRLIEDGIFKFGHDWPQIVQWAKLKRTPKQVKARFERLLLSQAKRGGNIESAALSVPGVRQQDAAQTSTPHRISNSSTPQRNAASSSCVQSPSLKMNTVEHDIAQTPRKLRIDDYFKPEQQVSQKDNANMILYDEHLRVQKELSSKISSLQDDIMQKEQSIKSLHNEKHQTITFYEDKLSDLSEKYDHQAKSAQNALKLLILDNAKAGRLECRRSAALNSLQLGSLMTEQHGHGYRETLSDGQLLMDMDEKVKRIQQMKEDIEKQRKQLTLKRKHSKISDNSDSIQNLDFELYEQDEALKWKLGNLKKEEGDLMLEREKIHHQKELHAIELRRIRDEDCSKFKDFPLFDNRYLLTKLVGKGGFSEVYKAFDLHTFREVACKIQTLNQQWSYQKRQNYIKHVIRELKIHKSLNHQRIVHLYEMFEIDDNSFAIVLEYCPNMDLDMYCKSLPLSSNRCLPEKEAKAIILQVFNALKYLNSINPPVIHYDLKPANILMFDDGIKLTDFGLSKIIENDCGDGDIELTSQFAGTYYYLPPECFYQGNVSGENGGGGVRISSKVDVWSAGVIFYQLLFGVKPFGQDQSQNTILAENTIMKAYNVTFPAKPNISIEAQNFIKRCLEYRQELRPDVLTICCDPYLNPPKRIQVIPVNNSVVNGAHVNTNKTSMK
ncbi:hypothetical protein MP228_011687 [Amoeboaphelidium protococcarum]|nr:hypothetical protein MP228_011687 [Amoeboaphelidium protococcarum]